jgi:hypothetical protein
MKSRDFNAKIDDVSFVITDWDGELYEFETSEDWCKLTCYPSLEELQAFSRQLTRFIRQEKMKGKKEEKKP